MQLDNKTLTTEQVRTQVILDKTPSLVFMMEPGSLRFTFVNRSLMKVLDYTWDEMLSMSADQLNPAFSHQYCQQILAPLLSGVQSTVDFEMTFFCKNKAEIPVAIFLRVVELDDRQFLLAIAQDITVRKEQELHIARLTNFYKALSEVNQAILRLQNEAELLPLVCKMAVDFGGMALAWAGQVYEIQGVIKPVAKYGVGQSYLDEIAISISENDVSGRGPIGVAFRERRIVIVNDYQQDEMTRPWWARAAEVGWHAAAAFPILRAGKVFAVLSVHHAQRHAFNPEVVSLIEEMCEDISFALDNFDREKKRQELEEELRLASLVYQYSSQAMMVTDAANHIISVNQAYTHITGYAADEVIGKNPRILASGVHDELFYKAMWNTLKATQHWQGKIWSKRKNGEVYPEWLTINIVLDDEGEPYRYIASFYDITDKVRSEELIWKQANYDMLTDLPNRYMLHQRMVKEIAQAGDNGCALAVFYIDLDQFKEVNDTLGHQVGDQLLVEVAQRIKSCVTENDVVARLGGDEFTVILSAPYDTGYVAKIAELIIDKLVTGFVLAENRRAIYISASIGVAFYPADADNADDLLKSAEQAMYVAKNAGRNRLSFYTAELREKAFGRLSLLSDLRGALAANQFVLYFQPIVNLASGKITKAEALIRWQHPERGMVSPATFIPLAEETGLITAIGDWVFKEAAYWAKRWKSDRAGESIQVSVNMSPVQFKDDAVRIDKWLAHLHDIDLPGKNMAVEITEGLLLDVTATISDKLLGFRDAGIKVALDDFGTGYSALSYLKKFDIDYLKIDQSFVRDITSDPSDLALSEAIVVMAHKLGLKVIAEGVETEAQRDLLSKCGCDYAQGYFYAQPLSPEAFEQLLKTG
ncbi:MAG: EAL domain-containing protein [Sulfuriferula sp.]|nr:EAL domain-containing protein [Sulfuriferula sp.]